MARKLKSNHFIVSSNDLAGAMTRLKLEPPQIPGFAKLPIGIDDVSDAWVKGRKLIPEIIAVAQSIADPKTVIQWSYIVRDTSSILESRILSRSGKAPYIQIAPRQNDDWDITIISSKDQLDTMLASMCAQSLNFTEPQNVTGDGIKLSLSSLMALCSVADLDIQKSAKTLLSMSPNTSSNILTLPIDTHQAASLFGECIKTADMRWSSALMSAIAGPELIKSNEAAFASGGFRDLQKQDLMDEDGFLGPDCIGLINLLSRAQYAANLTLLNRSKKESSVQMVTIMPAGKLCLVLAWMGGENPNVTVSALPPTAVQSFVKNLTSLS